MNDADRNNEKNKVLEDLKLEYRHQQIREEGNDPAKTGQHVDDGGVVRGVDDAPTIYSMGGENGEDTESSDGPGAGRPEEVNSTYGTDSHPLGRDPIGKNDRKKPLAIDKSFKKSTPLSKESKNALNKFRKKKPKILGEDLLSGNVNDMLNDEDNS